MTQQKNKTQELIETIRSKVNRLISKESPKEEIDLVAEIGKDLDDTIKENQTLIDELASTKDTLIDYVKKGNVDTKTLPEDPTESKEIPDFEDFALEQIKNKKGK